MISFFHYHYLLVKKSEVKKELNYIVTGYDYASSDYLKLVSKESGNRIILFNEEGQISFDNYTDDFFEINVEQVLSTGYNEGFLQSDTLTKNNYYYLVLLDDGNILGVVTVVNTFYKLLDYTLTYFVLISLVSFVISIIMTNKVIKKIVKPINKINLVTPLENQVYDELSPLIIKIDKRNKFINSQIKELKTKQLEFNIITNNMNEALVVYGIDKKILSANLSAKRIFSCYQVTGITYLEFCRDPEYLKVMDNVFLGNVSEILINKNDRIYRLSANPVNIDNQYAAVLLIVDVTEYKRREQMRREFSANVSHELKTPLTSIIGFTEIMLNQVAKEEDHPRFIAQIYDEAKRLLTLIEDIIELSKLDENEVKEEFSLINLYILCQKVLTELQPKADKLFVSLNFEGNNFEIMGIESVIYEMIFNLCDNAISYNNKNGLVFLKLYQEEDYIYISVKDTGKGIALEYHERIFERFYCVDHSHSKITGGTGLGLSIVKNGAQLHNAEVFLESELNQGSEFKLQFMRVKDE